MVRVDHIVGKLKQWDVLGNRGFYLNSSSVLKVGGLIIHGTGQFSKRTLCLADLFSHIYIDLCANHWIVTVIAKAQEAGLVIYVRLSAVLNI